MSSDNFEYNYNEVEKSWKEVEENLRNFEKLYPVENYFDSSDDEDFSGNFRISKGRKEKNGNIFIGGFTTFSDFNLIEKNEKNETLNKDKEKENLFKRKMEKIIEDKKISANVCKENLDTSSNKSFDSLKTKFEDTMIKKIERTEKEKICNNELCIEKWESIKIQNKILLKENKLLFEKYQKVFEINKELKKDYIYLEQEKARERVGLYSSLYVNENKKTRDPKEIIFSLESKINRLEEQLKYYKGNNSKEFLSFQRRLQKKEKEIRNLKKNKRISKKISNIVLKKYFYYLENKEKENYNSFSSDGKEKISPFYDSFSSKIKIKKLREKNKKLEEIIEKEEKITDNIRKEKILRGKKIKNLKVERCFNVHTDFKEKYEKYKEEAKTVKEQNEILKKENKILKKKERGILKKLFEENSNLNRICCAVKSFIIEKNKKRKKEFFSSFFEKEFFKHKLFFGNHLKHRFEKDSRLEEKIVVDSLEKFFRKYNEEKEEFGLDLISKLKKNCVWRLKESYCPENTK